MRGSPKGSPPTVYNSDRVAICLGRLSKPATCYSGVSFRKNPSCCRGKRFLAPRTALGMTARLWRVMGGLPGGGFVDVPTSRLACSDTR